VAILAGHQIASAPMCLAMTVGVVIASLFPIHCLQSETQGIRQDELKRLVFAKFQGESWQNYTKGDPQKRGLQAALLAAF